MSYMNGQQSRDNEHLQFFVNNVKGEIDRFWSNLLDEFNTFSSEISDKLESIEKDYDEYRQKNGYPDGDNILAYNSSTDNVNQSNHKKKNNNHRPSMEYSQNHKININKRVINAQNKNTQKSRNKKKYKKFAKTGSNISAGHTRTLSTMEIPTTFKLDPIEKSILIIKPRAATTHCKDIYTTLLDENFYVTDFEEGTANSAYFEKLWAKKYGYLPYFKELCREMAMDTFLVLKVFRVNAINELIDLCGHDEPNKANLENENTLRAMFGKNVIQNAVYPAKNQQEVQHFNHDFFKQQPPPSPKQLQQSLVVIKPNAAHQFGDVIRAHLIGQNFEIIQQKVFNLNAFVYSNMSYDAPAQYTQQIIDYMASNAVIALIVQKENVYDELKRVVGDRDPDIAAQQQPESIRANYGENIIKNAIEFAANYQVYKKNIPTFFFDVNIMNQAIDMKDEHIDIDEEEMFDSPEPHGDDGYAIVVIKPHVSSYQIEHIQDLFADTDIQINKQKSINMPIESIRAMLQIEYHNTEIVQLMANHLSSDEILVWLVSCKQTENMSQRNIFNVLSSIVPPLRDKYGIDEIRDVMHYSTTSHNFKAIAHDFFFGFSGETPPKTPNINLKLKSIEETNNNPSQSPPHHHKRRDTEVKPFISQFTKEQRSIMVIKAHITTNQLFQIRKMLHDASIEVIKEKHMTLPVEILYNAFEMDGYDDDEYHSLCQYVASDEFITWMVQRENVYEQLRYVIGPEDPRHAKAKYPQSIRAYYGLDKQRNAVYFSPNEHIYNHQVGIFFFEDAEDAQDNNTDIPLVPDHDHPAEAKVAANVNTLTQFDYLNAKLSALATQQQTQQTQQSTTPTRDDEYALVLLSSVVISNAVILERIKSRMTQNKFIIVDELTSYLPSKVISEMFNDGYSSFGSDGPPIPKQQFDELLATFDNGEILALHVCRQNGYVLLDQLRLELEKYKLTTAAYITLSVRDYQSKCAHFFEAGTVASDDDNDKGTVISKLAPSVHTNKTAQSYDNNERAIIIFKPDVNEEQRADIRRMFVDEMLHIFDETQTYIPRKTLRDILNHENYDEYYMDQLCEFWAGHALVAWLVKGENVYKDLMLIVGPEDSDIARIQAPDSIRAIYGKDRIQNVLYFTKNQEIYEETHRYFFFDEPQIEDNDMMNGSSSHSHSTRRQKKPLQRQLDEFEAQTQERSVTTLMETDEEQRAILILQHYLNESEIDSIRVILDNKDIEIMQEKATFLPSDTYQTIFQVSKPNWNTNRISETCEYYAGGQCTAFLMAKPGLYALLETVVGDKHPSFAAEGSIRQLFGVDELKNACFFTPNPASYTAVFDEFFFEHNSAVNTNSVPAMSTVLSKLSKRTTGNSVRSKQEKSILVLKPHMEGTEIEQVETMVYNNGLNIVQQKTCYLPLDVWYLCMRDEVVDETHLAVEAQHLSSAAITAFLVVGDDAFDKLADLVGPAEPSVAKSHFPDCIRAKFGIDEVRNCCWWSKNEATYKRIFHKFFFSENSVPPQHTNQANTYETQSDVSFQSSNYLYSPSKYRPVMTTASVSPSFRKMDKTLLIIKPHVSKGEQAKIRSILLSNGINIIQEKYTHLAKESCKFLLSAEGYDENKLSVLVNNLNNGELHAMLVTKEGIFDELHHIIGPSDPRLARETAPNSIRALFGKDIVRNCVYYTKSKKHYKKAFSFFFFEDKSETVPVRNGTANSVNGTENDDVSEHNVSVLSLPSKYRVNAGAASETASVSYSIQQTDKTLMIIKPHVSNEHREAIRNILEASGINIIQEKDTHLAKESCKYLLAAEGYDESYISVLTNELNKGELRAYLVSKEGIFDELKRIVGPSDPNVARKVAPHSIRALYGIDVVRNCVYYTKSKRHYKKVFSFFFFEDVSENPLDETGDADNSNSALLDGNPDNDAYTVPSINDYKVEVEHDYETASATSYGYNSHNYYNQCAPCAVLIIKPHAMEHQHAIEHLLQSHDINILAKRTAAIHADAIYGFLKANASFQSLNKQVMSLIVEDMCTGDVCVYSLGDETNKSFGKVQQGLNRVLEISQIISKKYGLDQIRNAVYCSRDVPEMRKQRKFFFLDSVFFKHESIDDSYQYSFMIVKPNGFKYRTKILHLLKSKEFNVVVNKKMQSMELSVAQQFFHPYFATIEGFDEFCESMTFGQWAVIMVSRVGNCINALQQFTEQIQSMYSSGDSSIADKAVYVCRCEADFWRDRAFFFFNDGAVHFADNGSVNTLKSKRKRFGTPALSEDHSLKVNKRNTAIQNAVLSVNESVHSAQTQLSTMFALDPIEETILIIKPHATEYAGDVERLLAKRGFFIGKSRPMNMPAMVWQDFYRKYENKSFFEKLCAAMAEDQIICYMLYRVNAISCLNELVGPFDPNDAKLHSPHCLRAIYGIDLIHNGFHCSGTEQDVLTEKSELFFEEDFVVNSMKDSHSQYSGNSHSKYKHKLNQATDRIFVIIKPNAAKLYGDRVRTQLIGGGFDIVKQKVVHLSESVYANLKLDIPQHYFEEEIQYLASDQIIVMVLEKINGLQDIVEMAGDRDPNVAVQEQPGSIRAIYGTNLIQNAIEVSLTKEVFLENYDVFFDDEDNISETTSYQVFKKQIKDKKLKLIQLQKNSKKQKCLLIIKPHITSNNVNYIKQRLINLDFEIMSEKHLNLPYDAFVDAFEKDYVSNDLDAICREWSSGEITIFILSKLNAFRTIKTLIGPGDPEIARSEAPNSIRATFGIDRIKNCCWYSANQKQYSHKLQHFEY